MARPFGPPEIHWRSVSLVFDVVCLVCALQVKARVCDGCCENRAALTLFIQNSLF